MYAGTIDASITKRILSEDEIDQLQQIFENGGDVFGSIHSIKLIEDFNIRYMIDMKYCDLLSHIINKDPDMLKKTMSKEHMFWIFNNITEEYRTGLKLVFKNVSSHSILLKAFVSALHFEKDGDTLASYFRTYASCR
jgi:hypothetical protein